MHPFHTVPPAPSKIEIVRPTLRGAPVRRDWRMTNSLTLGAALIAVMLSVMLSGATTGSVCALPLDAVQPRACE